MLINRTSLSQTVDAINAAQFEGRALAVTERSQAARWIAARQGLPSRARDLIGKEPDLVEEFDVEATIEGRYAQEELSRLGLAFE